MSAALPFFPSCREVADLLSAHLEGELPWPRRLGVRLHLGMCPSCQRLLASLRALPSLLKRVLEAEAGPPPETARMALDAALARLGQPRFRRPLAGPPAEVAADLAEGRAGLTLRLLAEAQRLIQAAGPAAEPPYLPAEIGAQVAPASEWTWRRLGGARLACLCRDPDARLYLLALAPGKRFPQHVHLGSENLLLLQGGLEDGERHCGPGDWCFHPAGSGHAPVADRQGCWALARQEGEVAFGGWRGLLQRRSG